MSEGLLTIEEAAAHLKMHPVTLRRMLRDGELPGVKLGKREWRVPSSALEAFISGQLNKPAELSVQPKTVRPTPEAISEPVIREIPIDSIKVDQSIRPRAATDYHAIEDYADFMQAGAKFPPVDVFYDGSEYWLADGFYRHEAAFGAERETLECIVHSGNREDAQWFAFSANRMNGDRRTTQDIGPLVKQMLAHPRSHGLSDEDMAAHLGVPPSMFQDWKLVAEKPRGKKRRPKQPKAEGV